MMEEKEKKKMVNNENKTNKQTKVGTLQRPFASELSALYNRKSTRTHTQPQANPDLKNKTKQNTKKKKKPHEIRQVQVQYCDKRTLELV